ncbi:toll/interleukin-1 receptor domain-containing protein [Nocardia takedensis]|uniref:toll/interleukin-1 receptor domain-containing protein n=1 Tax=Nocardia takedensis TaxID=259390 RepID=UPI0009FF7504|nr:TIR domain-containing protein [Nocardia takedensis]
MVAVGKWSDTGTLAENVSILGGWRRQQQLRSATSGLDIFVSYSRSNDEDLAPHLQRGLTRLGRAWSRPYALRVFRDQTDLTASPDLWHDIEKALAASRFLLLLASPASATSPWVQREIAYWQQHRSRDSLLIAVTDGEMRWSERTRDFDWARTNALPVTLSGFFGGREPLWVDLRRHRYAEPTMRDPQFADAVATLAAPVHRVSKFQLIGEDVRAHRTFTRIRAGAVTALVALVVIAMVAGSIAVHQRDRAREEARIALSRQLASTADSLMSTNLRAALQLAVSAFHTDASPQTMSTLIRANLAVPQLERILSADTPIVQAVGSIDGTTVVTAHSDGRVLRWDATGPGVPESVGSLTDPARSLAVNQDATVVVATDRTKAILWHEGHPPLKIGLQQGHIVHNVGVSPSGRTVAISSSSPSNDARSITIFDTANKIAIVRDDPLPRTATTTVTVISEQEILLFDTLMGGWDRRRISTWSSIDSSSIHLGTHHQVASASLNGEFLAATDGSSIPVWTTRRPWDSDSTNAGTQLIAHAPTSAPPGKLALSADGTKVAINTGGSIYISEVRPRNGSPRPATELTGAGTVESISFFGDGSRLLTISGNNVALWKADQIDRLARQIPVPAHYTCRGCQGPTLALSPDGRRVAVVNDGTLIVQVTPGSADSPVVQKAAGVVLWTGEARAVIIDSSRKPNRTDEAIPSSRIPGNVPVAAAALRADRQTAVVIDTEGRIYLHDLNAQTSRMLSPQMPGSKNPTSGQLHSVIAPTADLIAMVSHHPDEPNSEQVDIIDTATGRTVGTIVRDDIASVVFAGPQLLINRDNRTLEVWDRRGTRVQRTISDVNFAVVGNHGGTMVAESTHSSVNLIDLRLGLPLATLALPPLQDLDLQRTSVVFSPDDSRLITVTTSASSDTDGWLVERDLAAESLIMSACAAAGSALTGSEVFSITGLARLPEPLCV